MTPTELKSHGHQAIEPALQHEDFEAALRTALAAFLQYQPEVVVRSSGGGAVRGGRNPTRPLVSGHQSATRQEPKKQSRNKRVKHTRGIR
jgi:hypothetical protein